MNLEQLDAQLASQLDQHHSLEAIDTMSEHAPARRLVWWGCQCAWSLWRPEPVAAEDDALRLIVRWVVEQSDERRIACESMAKTEAAAVTQSRWLLQAAVFSGGELRSSNSPIASPTPDVSGRYVNGFLQNLLAQTDPVERHRLAHSFVQLARQSLAHPLPEPSAPATALV